MFSDGNVRHVNAFRLLGKRSPRSASFAVLDQTLPKSGCVTGLLVNAIQHTASEFRPEELAQPSLKGYVDCEPPIRSLVFIFGLGVRLFQMLLGSGGAVF